MDVLMPQLGETVSEGKITTWFKAPGDTVAAGDNLFEIETDKVSMEITAINAGVLTEIRVPVGTVAPVGAVVATIGAAGSAVVAPSQTPAAPAPAPSPATAAAQAPAAAAAPAPVPAPAPRPATPSSDAAPLPASNGKLDPYFEVRTPAGKFAPARTATGAFATPLARRLASQNGIDLGRVTGSGPGGRIVAADVTAAPAAAPARAAALPTGMPASEIMTLYKDVPHTEVPVDGMRRTIAARLQLAKQTIPHFYVVTDLPTAALAALREDLNGAAPKGEDGKPQYRFSLNDMLLKAWAAALAAVPAANAVWAEDRILRFSRIDIAVAVAIENGLITPVVRGAEAKSLREISAEAKDLIARAKARKLKPNEYQGGATAISNMGMYGVREFSAIISPPHGTILAIGASRRQAIEKKDGSVGFETVTTVTLSCDHRVVDGALGAELLGALGDIVAHPFRLLI